MIDLYTPCFFCIEAVHKGLRRFTAGTEEAEVFKVCLNFLEQKSKIYRGEKKLQVSDALNRMFDQLLH